MIKIGLTGGIGSGKTLAAKVFKLLGVFVYNSDIAAKQLYYSNINLKNKLIESFGKDIYFKSGKLNKKYISKIIFENKQKLALINSIVHPFVKADFQKQLEIHKNEAYIIKESAILIESNAYKDVDQIIVVTAPEEERIARVCKRDNTSYNDVNKIISNQLSDNERLKYANFSIQNDEKQLIIPQILEIHKSILQNIL